MRLRRKITLAILPAVVLALFLTGWMVIRYATENSHEAIFRYSEGILAAYVTQDLEARVRLLKNNHLEDVPSFVSSYQQEALTAAAKLNLIWPGHLFIVDGKKNIIFCTTSELRGLLTAPWVNVLDELIRTHQTLHGHMPEGNEGFVAQYFEPWDWGVFISIKGDFLHARAQRIWVTVVVIGAITCLVLVLIMSLVLHKFILTPLNLLRDATEQIAMEEIGVTIPVSDGDEFGELSRDIEGMSYRIQQSREALQRAVDELRTLDVMKTSLITNLSHEMRTPLTSIIGFAKLGLKRIGPLPEPLAGIAEEEPQSRTALYDALETISAKGECMAAMIENIITLMSLFRRDALGERTPQNIATLVMKIADEMRAGIQGKGLSLSVEVPAQPLFAEVAANLIVLVLRHYLANAIAFTATGTISIRAQIRDGEIVVMVQDSGAGLSAENAQKVFDEFYQVGDIMTEKPKGLGIGLSICRKIIELHRGRVWVESTLGKGSTFCFSLPVGVSGE